MNLDLIGATVISGQLLYNSQPSSPLTELKGMEKMGHNHWEKGGMLGNDKKRAVKHSVLCI